MMTFTRIFKTSALALALAAITSASTAGATPLVEHTRSRIHNVMIPKEDRFVPYALTIRAGDSVTWMNNDTDDHTIVSDDEFNTAGRKGIDMLIKGTDGNAGKPGVLTLKFAKPGMFVYYCRFHAQLDGSHQPVAPGSMGGIQDAKGNFGTAMTGVIVVLGAHDY